MKRILNLVRNIYWLYKPYIKSAKSLVFFSTVFSAIVMPVARVITVYFPELVMESLIQRASFMGTVYLIICVSMVQLAIPMFEDFFNIYVKEKSHSVVDMRSKKEIYEIAKQTDYQYIDSPEFYDDYSWAINEYANKCKDSFSLFETLLSTVSVIVGLFIAVLSSVPWAFVISLISISFRTWGYLKINQCEIERQDASIAYDRKRDYIQRVFYSREYALDIKGTNLCEFLFRDYDEACTRKIDIIKIYANKILKWAFSCDIVYRLSMISIIISIAYNIYVGRIESVGSYITLMLAVERLDECLYELFEIVKQATSLNLYAIRIKKFFERPSSIERSSGDIIPASGAFDIKMESVDFSYPSSTFAIKNFNLTINKGAKIAIVGENGAGKSTLLKLLMRLYDIDSGNILINDISIKEYNLNQLRKRIGVAFQNTHVYALTVKDNLELYHRIDEEDTLRFFQDINFRINPEKSQDLLAAEVTREFCDDGMEFSGGEVQKIGLARIMNGDFGLLILDEPSSALDPFSEHEVSKIIMSSSNKTTTIIISHRLSTIKNADQILLIENGEIQEFGTHEELMAKHKKYYEMFTLQADSYT